MIKLKEIVKNGNTVSCLAYVEDCTEPINLTLNLENEEFEDYTLPNGYEWCWLHISHIKFKLLEMINNNDLRQECMIMWC